MINFAGQNLFVHFLVAADVEKEDFFFCDFYRDNDSSSIYNGICMGTLVGICEYSNCKNRGSLK